MRLPDNPESDSPLSTSPPSFAGPSSLTLDSPGPSSLASTSGAVVPSATNGHSGTSSGNILHMSPSHSQNGHSDTLGNGSNGIGNGLLSLTKHGKSPISRVTLPGTYLYEDDPTIDREEFVRLVIQSLRDVGYRESAATLEAESGYTMETLDVSEFRRYVLDGLWSKAEAALPRLGVTDGEALMDAKFLINQQKYLELLEAQRTTEALRVLRNELAPLDVDSDQLHTLSSLIMYSDPEDLRQRSGWDGTAGTSRQKLLENLHRYISSSIMIPPRRFSAIIGQAQMFQRQRCLYHNSVASPSAFSLYSDHHCDRSAFPSITTTILDGHTDEVWGIEWSHDGRFLASASKDKTAIIWKVGPESEPSTRQWSTFHILREHPYPVGCLSWSLDDSILLTSSDNVIKIWNTKTGECISVLKEHTETVTALVWLSDGSGFISGGLDRKIIRWDQHGKKRETWEPAPIRVTDLAVTPDMTTLIATGMYDIPGVLPDRPTPTRQPSGNASASQGSNSDLAGPLTGNPAVARDLTDHRLVVYDLTTKQLESSANLDGELTSIKISQNSQYALINHASDEIYLWDLRLGRIVRKYIGQKQGHHVIRSCFGGVDGTFVVSGSEDSNVYVWHRDTGTLLEVLSGHGEGSVNSVAWNPRNERMFASCSDDHTVRIWESPPVEWSTIPDTVATLPTGKG